MFFTFVLRTCKRVASVLCRAIAALVFIVQLQMSAAANDSLDALKAIDRGEWSKIANIVEGKMMGSLQTDAEKNLFRNYLKSSDLVVKMATELQAGTYQGLGAVSTEFLDANLEEFISTRFGKGSSLHRLYGVGTDNKKLVKKLTKAALNVDSGAANDAIKNALKEYSLSKVEELRNLGTNRVKSILRSAIPGNAQFNKYNIDPLDLYLYAVKDWAKFVDASRKNFNNLALNCLWLRYRTYVDRGAGSHDAADRVRLTGMGSNMGRDSDCHKAAVRVFGEVDSGSVMNWWTWLGRTIGSSTGAEGTINLDRDEIVDLIIIYEAQGGYKNYPKFASWIENRVIKQVRNQATVLDEALAEDQKNVAADQKRLAQRFLSLVYAQIDRVLPPKKEDKTSPEKDDDGEPVTPEAPTLTTACDALERQIETADRKLRRGTFGNGRELSADLTSGVASARDTGNCGQSLYRKADAVQARISVAIRTQGKVQSALRVCGGLKEALKSVTKAGRKGIDFSSERSLLQTAMTALRAFSKGRSAYKKERLDTAESELHRARGAFRELPSGACDQYVQRTDKGLRKIATLRAEMNRVEKAINACAIEDMKRIDVNYKKRKHPFFKRSRRKIKQALPACAKQQRDHEVASNCQAAKELFERARTNYRQSRLDEAKAQLNQVLARIGKAERRFCREVQSNARGALAKIAKVRTLIAQSDAAIAACSAKKIDRALRAVQDQKLSILESARARLEQAHSRCAQDAREQNERDESERIAREKCREAAVLLANGRRNYKNNKLAAARSGLTRVVNMLGEAELKICPDVARRAATGLSNISRITQQEGLLQAAINACNIRRLQRLKVAYKGKNHRFFNSAIARIDAAIPNCEKDDPDVAESKFCDTARTRLDVARADFRANRLRKASRGLRQLEVELVPSKTRRCAELRGRVRTGLQNIAILGAEQARLQQAVAECNVKTLDKLKARYLGKSHPWYEEAAMHARGGLQNCRRRQAVDADENCRREATRSGKVYAKTSYNENGSHTCHFCERGQVSQGNVCVTDRAAAEADCRRMAAEKGKVYARTVIRNDGSSTCYWCEPGQIFNKNKCWSPGAYAEVECRKMATRRRKVYATYRLKSNGQFTCHWCERGQYYANGQCHSRTARRCPAGFVLDGDRCYPQRGGQQGSGRAQYACTYRSLPPVYVMTPLPNHNCVRVR